MKIGLGTVQFGLNYGVTNQHGQVSVNEARGILQTASDAGIRALDTASAYGSSESVLGALMPDFRNQFDIITKTVPLKASKVGLDEVEQVKSGFNRSMQRLGLGCVGALLVHHADNLLMPGGDRIYEQLLDWQRLGLVRGIGVSAYDVAQIEQVCARFRVDIVQLPVSVFDQRLVQNGALAELKRHGIAIHARSVYLQGLLLMSAGDVPERFRKWAPLITRYREYLEYHKVSPLQAAIGYVSSLSPVDVALVGVTTSQELEECVRSCQAGCALDLSEFACSDLDLIDPRRWSGRT